MKTFERGDAGKRRETRAIEYPQPSQRISYHPYAAPLHRIKTDDMLPVGAQCSFSFLHTSLL